MIEDSSLQIRAVLRLADWLLKHPRIANLWTGLAFGAIRVKLAHMAYLRVLEETLRIGKVTK